MAITYDSKTGKFIASTSGNASVKSSGTRSRSSGGSTVQNPNTGAGVQFITGYKDDGTPLYGYASAGESVQQGPKGSGGRTQVSGGGGGYIPGVSQSGSFTTAEGKPVNVRTTPTSAEALAERQRLLKQSRSLTDQQKAELEAVRQEEFLQSSNRRDVVVSYSDVERLNKDFREAGVQNAGELFGKVRSGEAKIESDGTFTITTSKNEELYNTSQNPFQIPRTVSPEETISDIGLKTYKPFVPVENVLKKKIYPVNNVFGYSLEAAEQKSKELFFVNVERPFKYGDDTFAPVLYTAGSVFLGLQNVGFSVFKTAEGNVAKNIFLPLSSESQGIVSDVVKFGVGAVTRPVSTAKGLYGKVSSNPAEFAGELLGFKAVGDLIPIKFEVTKDTSAPQFKAKLKATGEKIGETAAGYEYVREVSGEGMIEGVNINIFGKKVASIPNPKYTAFLESNPLYKEFKKIEVTIQPPKEQSFTIKREIIKKDGKTFITEKKIPSEGVGVEIPEGGGVASWLKKFYEENEYDNVLGRYVSKNKKGVFKDRFSGEEEGVNNFLPEGTGGVQGQGSELGREGMFKAVGDLRNPFNTGQGGQSSLNLLVGRKKFQPVEVVTEPVVIRASDLSKVTSIQDIRVFANVASKPSSSVKSIFSPSQKSFNVSTTRTDVISTSVQKQSMIPKASVFVSNRADIRSVQSSALSSVQAQAQAQAQASVQVQVQAQSQAQAQRQKQVSVQKQIQIQKQITTVKNIYGVETRQEKKAGGFDVFVKKKGVFQKANFGALGKNQAINFGASIVAGTSAASFKVLPSSSPAKPSREIYTDLSRFYKKGETFIEKNVFRINTPGELSEITYKGLMSKQIRKKIFGA